MECRPAASFGVFAQSKRFAIRKAASRGLQPWLGLFEFGLEWLSYIHIALDAGVKSDAKDSLPTNLVAYALTGSGVSFGLALRSLCLSGFDTPARGVVTELR